VRVKELCRKHGFSEASYYLWRRKFGNTSSLASLATQQRRVLAADSDEVVWFNVLRKYDMVLAVCEALSFEKDLSPYQEADGLVSLRNALVHFKPKWGHSTKEHAKLEKRLASCFGDCALMSQAPGQ